MKHPDWSGLLLYLCDIWDEPTLEVVGTPCEVGGGYSRTIWSLELASSEWPASRIYQVRCSDADGSGLALEVEKLRWLVDRGYPVSRPVCVVRDASVIGRPFAILEWIVGLSLDAIVQAEGWGAGGSRVCMIGELLARLHAIPSSGFPGQMDSSHQIPEFERISALLGASRAGLLRELIDTYRTLPSLDVVCHLDLHPRNIVMTNTGAYLIDWEKASRSHPLADIAMAQVHTEMAVELAEYPPLEESLNFGRLVLAGYLDHRLIDVRDLGYFRVIAACQRLGDVAGALHRPILHEKDRTKLQTEGALAIAIIDCEIDSIRTGES